MNQNTVITETVNNLLGQWEGTDPMTSEAQVREAVVLACESDVDPPRGEALDAIVEALLPRLCKIGLLITEYRAYDTTTEWMGPVRDTWEAASEDARAHNEGCASQGGYGSAIVVREDPRAPGRCVGLDGESVWPPFGRSHGAVRWR